MTRWHTLGKSICCYFVIRNLSDTKKKPKKPFYPRRRRMKVCHFTTRRRRQQAVSHRDVCEALLWCCVRASFPSTRAKMLSKQTRKNRFLQAHRCSALALLRPLHNANHWKPSLIPSQPPCSVHTRPSPVLWACHLPKQSESKQSLTAAGFSFISTGIWLRRIFVPILSYRFELSRR